MRAVTAPDGIRWSGPGVSVAEVATPGEHDGHAALLRRREHRVVALRTSGMDHGGGAGVPCDLERVGEGEERVRRDRRALRAVAGLPRRDPGRVDAGHL